MSVVQDLNSPAKPALTQTEIEELARIALETSALGHDVKPVDPEWAIKALGGAVHPAGLNPPEPRLRVLVNGEDDYSAGKPKFIVYAESGTLRRRNYALASALGKYMVDYVSNGRTQRAWYLPNEAPPLQESANRFASALLMPKPIMAQLVRQERSFAQIADVLGVSRNAAVLRWEHLRDK